MEPWAFKKRWLFNVFYIFDKGNQNGSKKHKLLENRFPFTKSNSRNLFRINRPEAFFRENDRRTFDFIKNDIFQTHMPKMRQRWKKPIKNIPSENFERPTPRTCLFFNCRLNASCNYDTLLMQANIELVFHCMKNMKLPLNAWVI